MSMPDPQYWRDRPVIVTGGAGFVGTVAVRQLRQAGADVTVIRSADHDLRDAGEAMKALEGANTVIDLAARVGGIGYHRSVPADMIRDNTLMAINVFDAALSHGVERLITAGTVCSYPKITPVPFEEDYMWNGYPEETNAPYGIAKRVSQVLSDTYRRQHGLNSGVVIFTNLYGPEDSFDLENGHVLPSLVRKFAEAIDNDSPTVEIWGTGTASREFLHIEDGARALVLAAEKLDTSDPVNIGSGEETPIKTLAEAVKRVSGYEGEIVWDSSKPDGQPRRSLDVNRARTLLGFKPTIGLEEGLEGTIEAFRAHQLELSAPSKGR